MRTKCTPLECQSTVEFVEVHKGCFRVKLSLGFFLCEFYNKDFSKDSELEELNR